MIKKKFFLEEVVDYTFRKYKDFKNLKVIFPNRRAGLYFQKALSKKIKKSDWSPLVFTMEDFVQKYSDIKISNDVTDSIQLNHILYQTISEHKGSYFANSFEDFFYWGQVMIKDFDDIELELVDESKVFKAVKNQKEIDKSFNFLDKENFDRIKSFWKKFFPKMTINQKNFTETWEIILEVFNRYRIRLINEKLAYKGLVYKEFLSMISSGKFQDKSDFLFVGFNVLSKSEKKILKYFIEKKSSMAFWDFDKYYFEDFNQESGDSFREFSEDKVLKSTFPEIKPNNFIDNDKKFTSIGISSNIGQSKVVGNILSKLIKNKKFDEDKVLILLPDENLLLPVLNSIPTQIKNINVTMGLSLQETPISGLIKLLFRIDKRKYKRDFKYCHYFKDVIELLTHPYIYQLDESISTQIILDINEKKKIDIKNEELSSYSIFLENVFDLQSNLILKLKRISEYLFNESKNLSVLDKEYIKSFLDIIYKIDGVNIKLNSYENEFKLLNQVLRMIRIPFSGEPLKGLQIMGVFESRNLDFDDVFILNMNEGNFPKSSFNISFIPFNIRKAFNLDTSDNHDKIYSYLFYRVIQRAKNITFIHNTTSSINTNGEVSRFIRQIDSESKFKIKNYFISDKLIPNERKKIVIEKDKNTLEKLKSRFFSNGYISPTGIKDYLECPLRFYYKYVANIRETYPISSDILKSDFGRISHKVLEDIYSDIIKNKVNPIIDKNDFFKIKAGITGTIKRTLKAHFNLKKNNELFLEGNNLILNEIMNNYISQVIKIDEKYSPFKIINLEGERKSGYLKTLQLNNNHKISISGIIDRIDFKNDTFRIIDYKTGGDVKNIKSIESLFSNKKKDRNDAVFQLFFYSILLKNKFKKSHRIVPGLMNIREINKGNFSINISINNKKIEDINPYIEEFESLLIKKLSEIFDADKPFTENDDIDSCTYCAYKNLHSG
jgi:hypothetical protein